MGTTWGRFRNFSEKIGTAKVFGDGVDRLWKRFQNVSYVKSVSFMKDRLFNFLYVLVLENN